MFQNALITLDGSELSRAALRYVSQVVDPAGVVTVIQVIDDAAHLMTKTTTAGFEFGINPSFGLRVIDDLIAGERVAAEAELASARQYLRDAGITNVEPVILQGIPGEAIIEEARRRAVDVVLMATHGRSGLSRTVLGSVADHVLRHLEDTPVLLVSPSRRA
jgi:nucleotide-binding universal stress UspA family protein